MVGCLERGIKVQCGRRKFLLIPFWAWERYHGRSLQPGSLIPGQEVGKGFGSLKSGHQYLFDVNLLPQERALGLWEVCWYSPAEESLSRVPECL